MKKAKKILMILALVAIVLLLVGFVTMSLWNWLVPTLFNGPVISFWQAVGLFILAKLLFGGFRGRPGGPPAWKKKYYDKLSSMSPEERERFKEKMKEKWCSHSRPKDDSNV